MTFRVGDPVVCIDDQFDAYTKQAATALPKRGEVYVVRGFAEGMSADGVWKTGLLLRELRNPNASSGSEHCFNPERFRPVVSPKQEASFTTGADPDSEQYDNRRRVAEPAWGASA
jgi:uncharacterized protein (DUF1330 family)